MSQAAVRRAPVTTTSEAIQRYVAVTFARFERTLVKVIPTLGEPVPTDPYRAMQRLQFLVETLAGFAIGSTIGWVGTTLKRGFGSAITQVVSRELAAIAQQRITIERAPVLASPPRRFLVDAAHNPLLNELGTRLQIRLCLSITHTRRIVTALVAAAEKEAPDQRDAIAMTLELLANDDATELAFADQLTLGWRQLCAVNHGERAPEVESTTRWQRSRQTWQDWSRRARGIAVEQVPDQDAVVRAGYVMRIG
ncbi:MAG: hypothetical protein WKG01_37145 [Kofleriaceae bacterium]